MPSSVYFLFSKMDSRDCRLFKSGAYHEDIVYP